MSEADANFILDNGCFCIWITPVVSNGRLLYVLLCHNHASNYTVMEMLVLSVQRHIELQAGTLIHVADLGAVSFPASDVVAV
jgi:hypothetical protein